MQSFFGRWRKNNSEQKKRENISDALHAAQYIGLVLGLYQFLKGNVLTGMMTTAFAVVLERIAEHYFKTQPDGSGTAQYISQHYTNVTKLKKPIVEGVKEDLSDLAVNAFRRK